MRVMSYNTLFAGFDGSDDRRYRSQIAVIRDIAPDILLIQEAKDYLANGSARLYATETELGMRGFVAQAPVTGQNTAIFIRPESTVQSFEADGAHFHHAAAFLKVLVPGFDKPITFVSVHLCPNSPDIRLREVSYLFNLAKPDDLVLIAGDFNSVSPDDPEPVDMVDLPARFRMRYTKQDGTSDRSTIGSLLRAGFVDVALGKPGGDVTTVPAAGFTNTEFASFRSDYIFATEALARTARSFAVVRGELTDHASDHYPVWADFKA